jgi:hypothetical protein
VSGLEHLPVPAAPQRPPCLSKEHLQIADESELRGETSSAAAAAAIYNFQVPVVANSRFGTRFWLLKLKFSRLFQNTVEKGLVTWRVDTLIFAIVIITGNVNVLSKN